MSSTKSAVICSAGVGSRLGMERPKCLVHVEGRPIIHWQLDLLEDYESVVVVVGFKAAQVMEAVLARRSDAIFAVNHDYETTNTLDSLRLGVAPLGGPFLFLDGDVLATPDAIEALEAAPCPSIAVKRTQSEDPVCVTIAGGRQQGMVTGFTRERREYEWACLARLLPEHVTSADGVGYVYQAVERILPVNGVVVDCVEIDTRNDLEEASLWMRDQTVSSSFGKRAAS